MKKSITTALALSLLAPLARAGAKVNTPDAPARNDITAIDPNEVVATINNKPITMAELQRPLLESHGLEILLRMMQLNLAKQVADSKNITCTQADFDAELERTMKKGFKDASKEDYPTLLAQLLEKQHTSRAEFDMVIQTNAILRKIAAPDLQGKITPDMVKETFNQLYGETVIVSDIQCGNPTKALQAKAHLAAGEKFENVVRTMSENAVTRDMDGELPQFSRAQNEWGGGIPGKIPQGFKDWAFTAKPGDVSDAIEAAGAFHILRLEKRVAPKVVQFTPAVQAELKAMLEENLMTKGINELRVKLLQFSQQHMDIKDPILKQQFQQKIAETAKAAQAEQSARKDIMSRVRPATEPSARDLVAPLKPFNPDAQKTPSGTPGAQGGAAASPASASTGERPPATKSAPPADTTPAK